MHTKKALEIFRNNFPEITIKSLYKKEGSENYILDINDAYICKIAKKKSLQTGLQNEAKILTILHGQLTTSLPSLLYCSDELLIYTKILGKELSPSAYAQLTSKQKITLRMI